MGEFNGRRLTTATRRYANEVRQIGWLLKGDNAAAEGLANAMMAEPLLFCRTLVPRDIHALVEAVRECTTRAEVRTLATAYLPTNVVDRWLKG